MKYKQYAVKFATPKDFVATYSDGAIKHFIFRNHKKLVIKKCDGLWFTDENNFISRLEYGDTWESVLSSYRYDILRTYLNFDLYTEDFISNFNKKIMVYHFTKEDMDSEDSFESVIYLISNLIVKPTVIPEEDGSYYLQYEAHINNSILIKVKTDGSVIVFDRDTDKNIVFKYVKDACDLTNDILRSKYEI